MKRQFYDCETGFSQSYLLGRIVRNAKRSEKIPFFIRETGLNPLWWTEPFFSRFANLLEVIVPSPLGEKVKDEGQSARATLTLALSRQRERELINDF